MKTVNTKTVKTVSTFFAIIFLSLFVTSCTDLNDEEDQFLIDNVETTSGTSFTGEDTGGSNGGDKDDV